MSEADREQFCPGCGRISRLGVAECSNCHYEFPPAHDFLVPPQPLNSACFEPVTNIKIIGVGAGGANVVSRMIKEGLAGAEFWVMASDNDVLEESSANRSVQLGPASTGGRGADGNPDIGRCSAEESQADIRAALAGAGMAVLIVGMGRGTGTGAAPVIAEIARNMGIPTVAIATQPFRFEGPQRLEAAAEGLAHLTALADAVFVIQNDYLVDIAPPGANLVDTFAIADDIIRLCIQRLSGLWHTLPIAGSLGVEYRDEGGGGGYYECSLIPD